MKRILVVIIVICLLGLVSLAEVVESKDVVEAEFVTYYEDNEAINIFLNRYNNANQDKLIESGMFKKYYHHGSEHDDQIILELDAFEILITNVYTFSEGHKLRVNIQAKEFKTKDEYQVLFGRFAKAYSNTMTEELIEECWKILWEDITNDVDFEIFECDLYTWDERIEYMVMEGILPFEEELP